MREGRRGRGSRAQTSTNISMIMKRRRSILAAATLLVGEKCTSYVPPVTSRLGLSFVKLNRGVKRIRRGHNRLLLSNFYDDWEEFSDFDSSSSGDDDGSKKERDPGDSPNMDSLGDDNSISATDDAVMKSLRERMNDLNTSDEKEEDGDDDEDIFVDDGDSGSALADLEGRKIDSIDELIGFAQAKAREKRRDVSGSGSAISGTWEEENWAIPIPHKDDDGNILPNLEDLLEGGIVLVANPAKFCSDLADGRGGDRPKKKGILEGLFDDPFPTSKDSEGVSLALLAKFGITLPPSPDLGPDRRADLLPVILLTARDEQGCQAVLMNRRTGNLMGDLPPSLFDSTEETGGFSSPHPLAAFMIQPLWWAGSSPSSKLDDESLDTGSSGMKAIDMVHACPFVNGSTPLPKSDGLYWGGDPVQAQEAMSDSRLEKPLSGFDFKFFIQTTKWLPSQLEDEIRDGVWYLAEVSKEVLFRSRDRLGAKRAKPLWTEIIELLDYRDIRDQLYGEEGEENREL